MVKVLDMKFIRYSNLFHNVTRISSNHCFEYNNSIIFVVPRNVLSRALGPGNINLDKIGSIIGKRVKIIPIPSGIEEIENFVSIITRPIRIKTIEVKDNEAIINANQQSKASLIGRDKVRLEEMEKILGQYFNIKKIRIK